MIYAVMNENNLCVKHIDGTLDDAIKYAEEHNHEKINVNGKLIWDKTRSFLDDVQRQTELEAPFEYGSTHILSKDCKAILNIRALEVLGENIRLELLDGFYTIFSDGIKTHTFKTFNPILKRFGGLGVEVKQYN